MRTAPRVADREGPPAARSEAQRSEHGLGRGPPARSRGEHRRLCPAAPRGGPPDHYQAWADQHRTTTPCTRARPTLRARAVPCGASSLSRRRAPLTGAVRSVGMGPLMACWTPLPSAVLVTRGCVARVQQEAQTQQLAPAACSERCFCARQAALSPWPNCLQQPCVARFAHLPVHLLPDLREPRKFCQGIV